MLCALLSSNPSTLLPWHRWTKVLSCCCWTGIGSGWGRIWGRAVSGQCFWPTCAVPGQTAGLHRRQALPQLQTATQTRRAQRVCFRVTVTHPLILLTKHSPMMKCNTEEERNDEWQLILRITCGTVSGKLLVTPACTRATSRYCRGTNDYLFREKIWYM